MAEPIKMLSGMWTRVDPRKHVLHGGPHPHNEVAVLEGGSGPPRIDADMFGGRYTQSDSAGAASVWYRCRLGCILDRVHIGTTWQIRLNRLCPAAMRSYVQLL